MRALATILWHFPFLGFLRALVVFIFGTLLTLTVVAAPIGLGWIQYSRFLFTPFSNEMVDAGAVGRQQNPYWKAYGTIIWIISLPIGILACIGGVFMTVAMAITIIGIPCAVVEAKSLGFFLKPVGKVCVPAGVSDEIRRRQIEEIVNRSNPK